MGNSCSVGKSVSSKKKKKKNSSREKKMFLNACSFLRREDQFHHFYQEGSLIGQGSFALVKEAKRKSDETIWAVKIVKREQLSPDDEQSLLSEVSIMEHLNHPNIVLFKEFFERGTQ